MTIDQATFEHAVRLTLIGISTAFALLVLLAVVISTVGRALAFVDQRRADSAARARDRALAAVIAVSSLREQRDRPPVTP